MDPIRLDPVPALRDPILVSAFRGWNDGGSAATVAAAFLRNRCDAQVFGTIDPDDFVDMQQTRPTVHLEEGSVRRITWPETEFLHAPLPGLDRDLVLVIGVEPNYRWRSFSSAITTMAEQVGVTLAITLGGLLADTPRTTPT